MKALKEMSYIEKAKLLADLFPEQTANILQFFRQQTAYFFENEAAIKKTWSDTWARAEAWYQLVRNAEDALRNEVFILKRTKAFADYFFDGYNALYGEYCLIGYSHREDCDRRLRECIQFLFGKEPSVSITIKNQQL